MHLFQSFLQGRTQSEDSLIYTPPYFTPFVCKHFLPPNAETPHKLRGDSKAGEEIKQNLPRKATDYTPSSARDTTHNSTLCHPRISSDIMRRGKEETKKGQVSRILPTLALDYNIW